MSEPNLLHANWQPKNVSDDPTDNLMNCTFAMMVSRSMAISPLYAEFASVPQTTEAIEATHKHAMINTNINIPSCAEIFAIGGKPLFRNVRDSVRMYTVLCNYLLAFKEAYKNEVFMLDKNDRMMANVLKLENWAEYVYRIAAPMMTNEDKVSADSLLGRLGRLGRGRFTRDMFQKKKAEDLQPVDPNLMIVGSPEDAAVHERITDGVMEQHFEATRGRSANRSSGWG